MALQFLPVGKKALVTPKKATRLVVFGRSEVGVGGGGAVDELEAVGLVSM